MTRKILPDVETLRQLLDYNPETGILTWKARDETICPDDRVRKSFNTQFAGKIAGSVRSSDRLHYYEIQISPFGKFFSHRIAWKMHYGEEPPEIMDHVDGNGLNNKINNIRCATKFQNGWNAQKSSRNKSGYKGVSFNTEKNKWRAAIHVNNKTRLIGYFSTPEEAGEAYKKEAAILHGEFLRL